MTRIPAVLFALALLYVGPGTSTAEELYVDVPAGAVLKAARSIIAADPDAALITIDADGRPRVRTVTASPPETDMTIWIATRPTTRKVSQIRDDPRVTLYFNDDAAGAYVSIMGNATLHDDEPTKRAKNFYDEARLRAFWPVFPDGYLLIRVRPVWIEVLGHGIAPHPETWRPQAVVMPEGNE